MEQIEYRKVAGGYKLLKTVQVRTGIRPFGVHRVGNAFVQLDAAGLLTIVEGYFWDGASGPAMDSKSIMRASLVHDALYQLIREGYVHSMYRPAADILLAVILFDDGRERAAKLPASKRWFWTIVAWLRPIWVYLGVRLGGNKATQPKDPPVPELAP